MREYSTITPAFWIGETGKKLRGDANAQLLAMYLMTSPHSIMTGVFHCPVLYMSYETGIPMEGAQKALARLIDEGFCEFDEASDTIFVVKMAAYQIAPVLKPGDNRIVGLRKEMDKTPPSLMKSRFIATYAEAFCLNVNGKDSPKSDTKTSPSKAPSKPLPSQEQEQEQEQENICSDLLAQSEPTLTDFSIPLNDSTEYRILEKDLSEWKQAYQAVDVEQELRQIRAWVLANPTKRKTRRGAPSFIVRWLSKAQDLPHRNTNFGASVSGTSSAFAGGF